MKERKSKKKKRNTAVDVYNAVLDYLGRVCVWCGVTEKLVIHHIIPLKNGGSNNLGNLEVVCGDCHLKLHTQLGRIFQRKSCLIKKCSKCGKTEFRKLLFKDSLGLCSSCQERYYYNLKKYEIQTKLG